MALRARETITSQNSRPYLEQIGPTWGSTTASVAKAYAEDCATEDRSKMAWKWDAKMGSYYFASPKMEVRWSIGIVQVPESYEILQFRNLL